MIKENEYFGGEVYNEHIKGFHKGIEQCAHFFDVSTDYEGYEVMKMVDNGQLLDILDPTAQADEAQLVVPKEPQRIKVHAEDAEEEKEGGEE